MGFLLVSVYFLHPQLRTLCSVEAGEGESKVLIPALSRFLACSQELSLRKEKLMQMNKYEMHYMQNKYEIYMLVGGTKFTGQRALSHCV